MRKKIASKKHGTAIEWTHIPGYKGETWNPHGGCTPVSEGCKNCWAVRQANRFKNRFRQYEGTVKDGKWTGVIGCATGDMFYKPLRWRAPRAIFPCSMGDFFHPGADDWRERYWHTIYDTPQHLYLILTKRPERIPQCLPSFGKKEWPWPNVWLGATVENDDQQWRIAELLKVPAAKHFVSIEPMLSRITVPYIHALDWVICGGESGPGARLMDVAWARSIRDQCQAAGVPFFFKQWGEWMPDTYHPDKEGLCLRTASQLYPTYQWKRFGDISRFGRVGKKIAGRFLDHRTWGEFPDV